MDKTSLGKRVLATIKERKIEQKARWTFLLRDYVVWIFGTISLVLGSLAFSVIIYMIGHGGWSEYSYVSDSLLQFFLLSLPYFWIVFLILFVVIADYNIRHTKKGYRYRLPVVVVASILVSLAFGVLFYNVGMGQAIDDVLSENSSFYGHFLHPGAMIWQNPENGSLLGEILSVSSDSSFIFQDIDGNLWSVYFEKNSDPCFDEIIKGTRLKLLGEIEDEFFRAEFMTPLGSGRGILKERFKHIHRGIMFENEMMERKNLHRNMMNNNLEIPNN